MTGGRSRNDSRPFMTSEEVGVVGSQSPWHSAVRRPAAVAVAGLNVLRVTVQRVKTSAVSRAGVRPGTRDPSDLQGGGGSCCPDRSINGKHSGNIVIRKSREILLRGCRGPTARSDCLVRTYVGGPRCCGYLERPSTVSFAGRARRCC